MLICGSKNGKEWNIGIKDPYNKENLLKAIPVPPETCKGIATSGDYERFIEKNGKKYSHIINPKTGLPVENAHSVTVEAPNAITADALSTGISVGWEDNEFIKRIAAKQKIKVYMLTGKELSWKEF